jgi:hypothetical protein
MTAGPERSEETRLLPAGARAASGPAGSPEQPLLGRLPLPWLFSALSRLLLSADQREEFLGDLVEEANLRLRVSAPAEVTLWMWSQLLRSAPTLVGWRIRRLAVRPQPLRSAAGLLVASRAGHRGWPLSLAVSMSAHALVLLAVGSWVLWRVEEIEPSRALDIRTDGWLDPPPLEAPAPSSAGAPAPSTLQARARRIKTSRRPALVAPAAPAPAEATAPDAEAARGPSPPLAAVAGGPPRAAPPVVTDGRSVLQAGVFSRAGGAGSGPGWPQEQRVRLPPRVGEKRCLSCPTPQLPHPYARLGVGQEMVVRACVNVKGEVSSVEVLRGMDPLVDARVTETVRGWRLAPYSLDGHPVPFCYNTRFLFTTH